VDHPAALGGSNTTPPAVRRSAPDQRVIGAALADSMLADVIMATTS
jgi:hypothetical protein